MATSTVTREQRKADEERKRQVSHLDEVAETIRENALALAREKLAAIERRVDLRSLLDRPSFFDHFKYGLASGVASVLATNDQRVLAVYTYDPSLNQDSEIDEGVALDVMVHLLGLVSSSSAGLEAFIAALDRALTASLKELPSSRFARLESLLDVGLVTERDVRLGLGCAGLLSAVFAPPIKIWQRET